LGNILLISVLTLVIRFISLLLMLASPPLLAPNAGSATVFDHPTVIPFISAMLSQIGYGIGGKGAPEEPGRRKRTSREKSIFGQDSHGIHKQHRD
jgi:hypothetical protein